MGSGVLRLFGEVRLDGLPGASEDAMITNNYDVVSIQFTKLLIVIFKIQTVVTQPNRNQQIATVVTQLQW